MQSVDQLLQDFFALKWSNQMKMNEPKTKYFIPGHVIARTNQRTSHLSSICKYFTEDASFDEHAICRTKRRKRSSGTSSSWRHALVAKQRTTSDCNIRNRSRSNADQSLPDFSNRSSGQVYFWRSAECSSFIFKGWIPSNIRRSNTDISDSQWRREKYPEE